MLKSTDILIHLYPKQIYIGRLKRGYKLKPSWHDAEYHVEWQCLGTDLPPTYYPRLGERGYSLEQLSYTFVAKNASDDSRLTRMVLHSEKELIAFLLKHQYEN